MRIYTDNELTILSDVNINQPEAGRLLNLTVSQVYYWRSKHGFTDSKSKSNPLYPLAPNQPDTPSTGNKNRPRIHILSKRQLRNFNNKVVISNTTEECFIWIGSHCGKPQYKRATVQLGVPYYANRVAYAIKHHLDPGNWDVLHTCDNPSCVNPKHLWLGNHKDNMADMFNKGRFVPSYASTKIKRGSPEEKLALDLNIPIKTVSQLLGVTYQCIWLRRQ